jgi:CPA2 family monovalent cation:H+ antiporter-2
VLGYLAAGVVIGPLAQLITGADEIMRVAELGIVLLPVPDRTGTEAGALWSMRADIFGFGLAQVVITGNDSRRSVLSRRMARWPRRHRRLRPGNCPPRLSACRR